jgi:hypothetical protein
LEELLDRELSGLAMLRCHVELCLMLQPLMVGIQGALGAGIRVGSELGCGLIVVARFRDILEEAAGGVRRLGDA